MNRKRKRRGDKGEGRYFKANREKPWIGKDETTTISLKNILQMEQKNSFQNFKQIHFSLNAEISDSAY